jgi:hypothetical protein
VGEALKRDNRNADVRFFDSGHFALETHPAGEIAAAIGELLGARFRLSHGIVTRRLISDPKLMPSLRWLVCRRL